MSAKAAYAYDRGITGKGVTIAVVDSGINVSTSEFAGRVSAESTGFEQRIARCATCPGETVAPFPIADLDGHGTEVASVAAAARDGSGVLGVAPGATILALKVSGPDLDGVVAGSTAPLRESSLPNAALIAPALQQAVARGAFVTVLSINGRVGGQIAADQRNAMDAVRAADRMLVESVSNSTGEDSFAGQFAESFVGADLANKDWFLFAIGVGADGTPRSANGNPGALADRTIAAVGVNVQVVLKDGTIGTVTGNSFAAPAVGGAAALLKQHWPQLGGRAIARILLDTATDMGAPGIDAVFGVGLLNVEKAMQAQAPASSFATAQAVLARYSSMTVSAPFGGATTAAKIGSAAGTMTVLDRYGRDYRMTGATGPRVGTSGLLAGAMAVTFDPMDFRRWSATDDRLGFAGSAPVGPWQGAASNRPAVASFSPSAGQTVTIGANMVVGGGGGSSLSGSYLRGAVGQPVGMSSSWTAGGWSAAFSSGSSRNRRAGLRTASFSTPLGLGLEVAELAERGRVLGFGDGTSSALGGGRTMLATATARRSVAGVAFSARATMGSTQADGVDGGPMRFDGRLVSSAFAVEAARSMFGGFATFGLSSPLRVERARASLLVPVAYDLMSGALAEERRTFDLSPTARELDLELGWSTALAPSSTLRFGVARAFDAGHVRGASDTAGFLNLVIR